MPASGYTSHTFTAGEVPTTTIWNYLWGNDAAFNNGNGFNDGIIVWRHLTSDIVPTGLIIPYAGSTAPSANWLICNGSAVSRTTYAALFAVCSTAYGNGDGSTTFNLPDLTGRAPFGKNAGTFATLGGQGGAETVNLAHIHGTDSQGFHAHSFTTGAGQYNGGLASNILTSSTSNTPPGHFHTGATDGNGTHGHNISSTLGSTGTLSPYTTVNYLIKT
jgi:microcystin-dependent protein